MSFWNILLVPVIMGCAIGGTVGLMWLIKRFAHNDNIPDISFKNSGNNNEHKG